MSIMDKVTGLLPWRGDRRAPAARADLLTFREDLDRWLQELVKDAPRLLGAEEGQWTPSADVQETEQEVIVTLEVPGLDRDDLDITVTPEGLTIRGEKRAEREEQSKDLYLAERRYGSFVRTVPLSSGLDLDRAEARVKRGVLTIRLPKAAGRSRRTPWAR